MNRKTSVGGVAAPPTLRALALISVSRCSNTKDFPMLHTYDLRADSSFGWEVPTWLPQFASEGPEQIPRLHPASGPPAVPSHLVGFDRLGLDAESQDSMVHFFLDDKRILGLAKSPHRQLYRLSRYSCVATPDFSLYRSMPRHKRIGSVWMSRAVGVYFQSRGLEVVPCVRWSGPDDYDFCFTGVPHGAPVTISNHGCWRSRSDKLAFEDGLYTLVERLSPAHILLHGRRVSRELESFLARNSVEIHLYPPRIAVARSGRFDGGR